MAVKFLDNTGLGYFWGKIKAWCNATFAAITHNHASNTINAMTGYSKPNSGSAIATSDSLNSAIGKLEAKVDAVDVSNYAAINHTHNKLVSAGDNVASTSTDTYSLGVFNVRWFGETDKLPGQPSQWGFLATFGSEYNSAEVHQIFCVQPNGDLYHRGTNSSSYTAPPEFKKIIDSSNETQLSLTTSGSGNAITALSVSNHKITATKGTTFLTSHQTLPTLSVGSSGSGNAVTNITVSSHKITFTKGSTFLTSHQSLDSCVKTSGAQTVSGVKTFTNWPIVLHTRPGINLRDSDFVHTTASNHPSCSVQAKDKNDIMCGEILFHDYANSNTQRAWSVYVRPSSSNTASMISYHFYQGNDVVFVPGADNKYHFGTNSSRWAQFHAGTSSIATSDEREKTVLNELSNDFYNAWDELNFCQYKFNDAIEKKGIDNARIHIGLIAQRIKSVFSKYDLDAHKYGFFCYDEWDEQQADIDKDGNVLTPYKAAGNRYALRYEEALCIEAAYQRRKNKILENRISELERQVSDMLQILQNLTSSNG